MKIIKELKERYGLLISVSGLVYTLNKAIIGFYRGYHNLDLSFNFLNLGYSVDLSRSGQDILLKEAYLNGLNQMVGGFGWGCLTVIIALFVGYSIKKSLK